MKVYRTLDGIRGVAALCVVLYHAEPALAGMGYLAPDLFFVLSGFVIGHAYDRKLAGGMHVGEFLRIRLIRFYPLYLIGLGLGIAAFGLMPLALVTGLLFLPFPEKGSMLFPLNPPSWTLFYELVINLIYGSTFRFLTTRRLVVFAGLCAAGLVACAALRGTISGGWNANVGQVAVALVRVGFSFAIGLLLYRQKHRLPNITVPPVVILMAVAGILTRPPALYVELACVLIVFPLIVHFGANTEPKRFGGVFALLGLTSYGVYAIHYPLLALVHGGGNWTVAPFIVGLLAIVYALDRWIDAPVRRWLLKRCSPVPAPL
jgi:peptidoglycan/LPS O-acetylase OafA/YrhL